MTIILVKLNKKNTYKDNIIKIKIFILYRFTNLIISTLLLDDKIFTSDTPDNLDMDLLIYFDQQRLFQKLSLIDYC